VGPNIPVFVDVFFTGMNIDTEGGEQMKEREKGPPAAALTFFTVKKMRGRRKEHVLVSLVAYFTGQRYRHQWRSTKGRERKGSPGSGILFLQGPASQLYLH